MDSKSIGLCPQGFESPRCRFALRPLFACTRYNAANALICTVVQFGGPLRVRVQRKKMTFFPGCSPRAAGEHHPQLTTAANGADIIDRARIFNAPLPSAGDHTQKSGPVASKARLCCHFGHNVVTSSVQWVRSAK